MDLNTIIEKLEKVIGFEKNIVPPYESGADYEFSYYTYDIGDDLSFISNADDDWEKEGVIIELFNNRTFKWKLPNDFEKLESTIHHLEIAYCGNEG